MKKIMILLLTMSLLIGCAGPMRFQIPEGKVQSDFEKDLLDCGGKLEPSGGYCLFGPLFLIAPVVGIIETVKHVKKENTRKCMEAKGYKSIY